MIRPCSRSVSVGSEHRQRRNCRSLPEGEAGARPPEGEAGRCTQMAHHQHPEAHTFPCNRNDPSKPTESAPEPPVCNGPLAAHRKPLNLLVTKRKPQNQADSRRAPKPQACRPTPPTPRHNSPQPPATPHHPSPRPPAAPQAQPPRSRPAPPPTRIPDSTFVTPQHLPRSREHRQPPPATLSAARDVLAGQKRGTQSCQPHRIGVISALILGSHSPSVRTN